MHTLSKKKRKFAIRIERMFRVQWIHGLTSKCFRFKFSLGGQQTILVELLSVNLSFGRIAEVSDTIALSRYRLLQPTDSTIVTSLG